MPEPALEAPAPPAESREPGASAVLLTLAYDGAGFAGWASQPGQRTVAGVLLEAVRTIEPEVAEVRGASRTDAGVHAEGQRVAFDTRRSIAPRGWLLALNQRLPEDCAVRRAARVEHGFSPRFRSLGKHYRYTVRFDVARNPHGRGHAWQLFDAKLAPDALEVARREAHAALGSHDFGAFRSSRDVRASSARTLTRFDVDEVRQGSARVWTLDVEGPAFMHNMVRILVGTVIDVARGRRPRGAIVRALASRRRDDAGQTAPALGLCLVGMRLDDDGADAYPEDASSVP